MYEKKITADEILFQAAQELAVAGWKNAVKLRGEFLLILQIGFDLRRKAIRQQRVQSAAISPNSKNIRVY